MAMKVLLVDDERLICEGLKIILDTYEDIEIVGQGANGYEAFQLCKEKDIDIVLMDIRMPKCDGVQATKLIKESFPHIKVLILTTFNDAEYIKDALRYGALGYLLKDSDYDLIYQSIKAAYQGNVVIHPNVANTILSNTFVKVDTKEIAEKFALTEQEIKIMMEVADGKSNKEISEKMYLTEGTIKNHISAILSKLQLKNRTQLTAFAYKQGLTNM